MSIENEQEIISRAYAGDQRAMEMLVNEYAPVVYKFAFNICRQRDKAENTMQETFISVLKNLKQFDNRSKFTTWLYTIVSNHCLMLARSMKSNRFVSFDDEESALSEEYFIHPGETPHEHAERSDIKELLDEAIEKLSPEYRIVFTLRDIEGLSTEEVSHVTKLTIPAVKSRLHRARKFLRDRLAPFVVENHYA